MYAVTDDYRTGIYGLSRRVLGRVTFDIAPLNIQADDVGIIVSTAHSLSNKNQLVDKVRENTFNLSTWEANRTKLDGSFTFASDSPNQYGQVGYVSNDVSDADGVFATPITITHVFENTYSAAGVTVTFDTRNDEYAIDYIIRVYNDANSVLYQQTVASNTSSQPIWVQPIEHVKKIELQINRWSVGYRRARISEFELGVILIYDDDRLIRFNMTEELDMTSANLVIPEFEFVVDNSDQTFDMFNPSGLVQYLQNRQAIRPELGLELGNRVEWIPLGVFLLSEWRSDIGSLTATFKGRSVLDLLETSTYEQLTATPGLTLKTLIESILTNAGILVFDVDPALSSITTNGICERRTAREALQLAAMAGRATVRVTRDNIVRVEITRSTDIVDDVTFDEMLEEPQIELLRPTSSVKVAYYTNATTEAGQATATDASVVNGDTMLHDKNTFINTVSHAQSVANWLLSRFTERKKITANVRGNPAVELLDVINTENRYTTNLGVYLTKNEWTYEGYLSARMEGRAML